MLRSGHEQIHNNNTYPSILRSILRIGSQLPNRAAPESPECQVPSAMSGPGREKLAEAARVNERETPYS